MKKSKAIVKAKPASKPAKKKILPVLVNFILDKSGSMSSVLDETISGFNTYVDRLRKDRKSSYLFTLTLFDTESVDVPYLAAPLKDVKPLDRKNYVPGMSTPLYDAVGNTITLVEQNGQAEKTASVLTVIMTDGMENASREWSQDRVKQLIKDKEATGKWTFVFLGANLDAMSAGAAMGASAANSSPYYGPSTPATLLNLAGSTVAYAARMSSPTASASSKRSMSANFMKSTNFVAPDVDDAEDILNKAFQTTQPTTPKQ